MSRKVDLVRVAIDSQPNGVSEDAARPADEVFANEETKLKKVDESTISHVLGGKRTRFVSESELEARKAEHGERLEDGTFAGRTLREALAAQKAEREARFQEQWKVMKQGKHRPLEPDELEFLQALSAEESAAVRDTRKREAAALERFAALRKSVSDADGIGQRACEGQQLQEQQQQPGWPAKARRRAAVQVVRKAPTPGASSPVAAAGSSGDIAGGTSTGQAPRSRGPLVAGAVEDSHAAGHTAPLLGMYGESSESSDDGCGSNEAERGVT